MLRKQILQKYVDGKIIDIVHHDFSVHLGSIFGSMRKLALIVIIQLLLFEIRPDPRIYIACAIAGGLLMIKFCIEFFNEYLDGIALTTKGINVFVWESMLEYKMNIFERENLQVVSYIQNSIWDKILGKGDIYISLSNDVEFSFTNVSQPQKYVHKLLALKDKYVSNKNTQEYVTNTQSTMDKDKFNALVETLGEVIVDYMDRKK